MIVGLFSRSLSESCLNLAKSCEMLFGSADGKLVCQIMCGMGDRDKETKVLSGRRVSRKLANTFRNKDLSCTIFGRMYNNSFIYATYLHV